MARVPFDLPSQGVSTAPLAKQQAPGATPEAFGSGLAAGLADVGKAESGIGDMLAQHAVAFQQIDNKAEGDNLYTEYLNKTNTLNFGDGKTPGYTDLKGYAAVQAYPKVREQLLAARDEISAKATNPIVRQMFDQDSRRLASYSLGDMSRHASTERQRYLSDTNAGVIATTQNDIALNYEDPQRVNNGIAVINGQLAERGQMEGWDPAKIAQEQTKATSAALQSVIERTADKDPFRARDMYHQLQPKLDAASQLHLDNFFKQTLNPLEGYNSAQTIVRGNISIPDAQKFNDVLIKEGEKSAPGAVSPKGAKGVGQVLDSTGIAVAKELGIPWQPALMTGTTPEAVAYQRQISKGYSDSLMRQFGGNTALATAAYNAGPGVVRDWMNGTNFSGKNASKLKLGDPSLGETDTNTFVRNIPFAETKAEVGRVMTALNIGAGVQPTADDPKAHLNDYLAEGARAAEYAHPGDVLYARTMDQQIRSAVGQASTAVTARRVAASNNISNVMMGGPNGQGPKPNNINDLFNAYPSAKTDWLALEPKAREAFLKQLTNNASGKTIQETPETLTRVAYLKGLANNNPDQFKSMDFAHEGDLPFADRRSLINMQIALGKKAPINENLSHALTIASPIIGPAGITKKDNPDAYNTFTGRMSQSIDGFIAIHNRKPNDSDIRKMTQDLMLETSHGFLGLGSKQAYESPYASLVSGVPDADARLISEAYKTKFHRDATDAEITSMFNARRNSRGGQ